MKAKWIKILAVIGAAVWWVVFYPELSFIEGTYQLVTADNDGQMISQDDTLSGLLSAGKDEIIIESRLLEWLSGK